MTNSPPKDLTLGSSTVGVLGNQFETGAVLATEQTRSITTAATGLKCDVENKAVSNYHITLNGNWNHYVQGTDNNNTQDSGDVRSPVSNDSQRLSGGGLSNNTDTLSPNKKFDTFAAVHTSMDIQNFGLNVGESLLQSPGSTKIYAEHFGARITERYYEILSQISLKRARRSREDRRQFRMEISTQKDRFCTINKSLAIALTSAKDNNMVSEICHEAHQCLIRIWTKLHSLQVCIESFGIKSENGSSSKNKKKSLSDCCEALGSQLDEFEKVAFSVILGESVHDSSTSPTKRRDTTLELQELDRLSAEGRLASMLYQCLCRACPGQCHSLHTAYLSLEPEDAEDTSSPSLPKLTQVVWRCHMAFKSTIVKQNPFIWLKVVSSGASVAELIQSEPGTDTQKPVASIGVPIANESINENPRKRRAASTPPEPPSKAPKVRPGQNPRRVSELAPPPEPPSRIEVCPELLAQHDLDTMVMNMIDDSGYNHNFFYLPKNKRPIHDSTDDPVTLSAILGNSQGRNSYQKIRNRKVLQLTRLIAEAVLRFDLRDSDPSPEDSVVFYKSPQKELAPFLKRVIKKPENCSAAIEDFENSSTRRTVLLTNLGQILLQLGLPNEKRSLDLPPQDLRSRRQYIRKGASDVRTHMGPAYHMVIIHCLDLSALGDDPSSTSEAEFQQRYYHDIVKPLKEMEDSLSKEL